MTGLRYISLAGSTGYAESARRYLPALVRQGMPVTWTPLVPGTGWHVGFEPFGGTSVDDPELDPFCNLPIPYDTVLLHVMPALYPRLIEMVGRKRIAAYAVWEADRIPAAWRSLLKDVELLLIPSEWNRKVFEAGGFEKPMEVVPHCLSYGQSPFPDTSKDSTEFVFYSIGVWSDRKAIDLTLHGYLRAFTARDPVRLVLKTSERHEMRRIPFTSWYPVHTQWMVSRILRKYPDPPPVTMITDNLPAEAMLDLHRQGDCYVSLTRSEGWGLGAFDAAAHGRPVIMTGFGGQTEFLPPDLAHLVKYRMVKIPFHPMEQFERGSHWAEPDVNHGAELMRYVFENRAQCREKARCLAVRLCAAYEADRIGGVMWDALRRHF